MRPAAGGAERRPRPLRGPTGVRRLAMGLIGLGLAVAALPFVLVAHGVWQERQLTQRWATEARPAPAHEPEGASPAAQPSAAPKPLPDGIAFAMRVPRIHYYAAVREGVSLSVLDTGPGHYQATAWPGRSGTVGIAGHNTSWLPFADVRPGDEVDLETRYGTFRYHVTGSRVVNPTDGSVLRPAADRQLVLTTCWPLGAGALAPQRLAIFARQD